MTITSVDSQTQTAPFVGAGLSISGITGDWTLKLDVTSLSSSDGSTPRVRFEFDDSVNSFTAYLAGPTDSFLGALAPANDRVHSWKKDVFPDLRFGTANALLRLQLSAITANASCSYHAWLEY